MSTRRRFLASAAGVAAVGAGEVATAKEVAVQQDPPHPDALLLSLIARFDALEHQINDLHSTAEEAALDEVTQPLKDEQQSLLGPICSIRATTPEGIVARGKSLVLWAADLLDTDTSSDCWDDRMLAALLRDLPGVGDTPA